MLVIVAAETRYLSEIAMKKNIVTTGTTTAVMKAGTAVAGMEKVTDMAKATVEVMAMAMDMDTTTNNQPIKNETGFSYREVCFVFI
jgi:hypothetical protein